MHGSNTLTYWEINSSYHHCTCTWLQHLPNECGIVSKVLAVSLFPVVLLALVLAGFIIWYYSRRKAEMKSVYLLVNDITGTYTCMHIFTIIL